MFRLRIEDDILFNLCKDLEPFRRETNVADLVVRKGKVARSGAAATDTLFVSEGSYQLDHLGSTYCVDGHHIVCDGPVNDDYLYGIILVSAINGLLVPKGWCLVHASAFSTGDKTILLPAFGGTGKTNMLLDFLLRGADFVGDDRVFVCEDGRFISFTKSVNLLHYNFSMFPELFDLVFPDRRERTRQRRKYSTYMAGLSMKDTSAPARLLKNFLTSRYYFSAKAPASFISGSSTTKMSGAITDVFVLVRGHGEQGVQSATPEEVGRFASASSWLDDSGWMHQIAAGLSGVQYHSIEEREDILMQAFQHADCYKVCLGNTYTREDLERMTEKIRTILGMPSQT